MSKVRGELFDVQQKLDRLQKSSEREYGLLADQQRRVVALEEARMALQKEEVELQRRLQAGRQAAAAEQAAGAQKDAAAEQGSEAEEGAAAEQGTGAEPSAGAEATPQSAPVVGANPSADSSCSGTAEPPAANGRSVSASKAGPAPSEVEAPADLSPSPGTSPCEDGAAAASEEQEDGTGGQQDPAGEALGQEPPQCVVRRPVPTVFGMSALRAAVVGAAADRSCGVSVAAPARRPSPKIPEPLSNPQDAAGGAAGEALPAVVSTLSADAAPFVLSPVPAGSAQRGVSPADEAPPGLQAEAGTSSGSAARRSRRRQPAAAGVGSAPPGIHARPASSGRNGAQADDEDVPPGFGGKPSSRADGVARPKRERRHSRQPLAQTPVSRKDKDAAAAAAAAAQRALNPKLGTTSPPAPQTANGGGSGATEASRDINGSWLRLQPETVTKSWADDQ